MQRFQYEMESDRYIFQDDVYDPIWEDLIHQRFIDKHPKYIQDSQMYGNYLDD